MEKRQSPNSYWMTDQKIVSGDRGKSGNLSFKIQLRCCSDTKALIERRSSPAVLRIQGCGDSKDDLCRGRDGAARSEGTPGEPIGEMQGGADHPVRCRCGQPDVRPPVSVPTVCTGWSTACKAPTDLALPFMLVDKMSRIRLHSVR